MINTYTPNIGTSNFIKQALLDRNIHIDSNTIIMDYFDTPFSSIGDLAPQKSTRNFRIKLHYRSKRFNRHLQNIQPNSLRMHIFFSIP
jgi:hypothetical protein